MREPEEGRAAGKGRRVCVLGEGGGQQKACVGSRYVWVYREGIITHPSVGLQRSQHLKVQRHVPNYFTHI